MNVLRNLMILTVSLILLLPLKSFASETANAPKGIPEKKQMRILIAVTSQDHYTTNNVPTGLWLSELVHFWDVMEQYGFKMDIVSPKGGKVPIEPRSLKSFYMDKATKQRYEDKKFMSMLDHSLASSEVNWKDYDAIYYAGGHGAMWDLREDKNLQIICKNLFENNRIVSSVCHGYCGLLDVKLSNGEYLIKGMTITGYSWFEEILAGVSKNVPYDAEQTAKDRGAKFEKGFFPFVSHVEVNGLMVTGQNPASAHDTARKVAALLANNEGNVKSQKYEYDVLNTAIIDAGTDVVYQAVIDEYDGKADWLMPIFSSKLSQGNTMGDIGSLCDVTGHEIVPIKFRLKTGATKKNEMIRFDYVDGVFIGEGLWTFENVDGKIRISFRWRANPNGFIMRMIGPFASIEKKHAENFEIGFKNLEKYLRTEKHK